MPKLSVVMIVKDEAHCLGDCLSSVRPIADEIVVGDTGSKDNTVAIARGFDARVIEVPWRDDFADARNRVLEAAQGDWLLTMDADEALDAEGALRIRGLVDADGAGADGIEVTLANYCNEPRSWRWTPAPPDDPHARGYAGYVAVGLVRLYRNGRGFEYRESVHENLAESLEENHAVVRIEDIKIHHYGYDSTKPRTKEKIRYYLRMAKKKIKKRPDDTKAWFDLASASRDCEDEVMAEKAAKKTLELRPDFVDAGGILADLYLRRGDYEAAKRVLGAFVEQGTAPPIFLAALGATFCAQGLLDEARPWLEKSLDLDPALVMGRLYMARFFDQTDDFESAREELERARDTAPALKEPRKRLEAFDLRAEGEARFGQGSPAEALKCFVAALELDSEDPLLHNDTGVALNALGQTQQARESFERALKLAPGLFIATQSLAALPKSRDADRDVKSG